MRARRTRVYTHAHCSSRGAWSTVRTRARLVYQPGLPMRSRGRRHSSAMAIVICAITTCALRGGEAVVFEYRRAPTRATDMPSAMPIRSHGANNCQPLYRPRLPMRSRGRRRSSAMAERIACCGPLPWAMHLGKYRAPPDTARL